MTGRPVHCKISRMLFASCVLRPRITSTTLNKSEMGAGMGAGMARMVTTSTSGGWNRRWVYSLPSKWSVRLSSSTTYSLFIPKYSMSRLPPSLTDSRGAKTQAPSLAGATPIMPSGGDLSALNVQARSPSIAAQEQSIFGECFV